MEASNQLLKQTQRQAWPRPAGPHRLSDSGSLLLNLPPESVPSNNNYLLLLMGGSSKTQLIHTGGSASHTWATSVWVGWRGSAPSVSHLPWTSVLVGACSSQGVAEVQEEMPNHTGYISSPGFRHIANISVTQASHRVKLRAKKKGSKLYIR